MKLLRWTCHVVSIVTLYAVLAACAFAQSQQPQDPPNRSSVAQKPPASDPRGTSAAPLVIQVQPTSKTDAETAEEQRQKDQEAFDRWLTQTLAIATVGILFVQLGAIGFQVWIAKGQNELIDTQNGILRRHRAIMRRQRKTTDDMLATSREIERAYITIGHSKVILVDSTTFPPPGGPGNPDEGDPDGVELVVEIANHGRTPGDVLGGFYGFVYDTASNGPNLAHVFGGARLSRLFVLPEEKIGFSAVVVLGQGKTARLTSKEWRDDAKYLWFLGEVDYRDRFGKIHRSMYCRRYSAHARGFLFGPETGPHNYDRPLTPEEIKQRAYDQSESQEAHS